MRYAGFAITALVAAGSTSVLPPVVGRLAHPVVIVDTVYMKSPAIDYAEVARQVALISRQQQGPTTIDGDLIVKGRIGVGGVPEPQTNYPITVHGSGDARMLFISNEALSDGQRVGTQHRHVGAIDHAMLLLPGAPYRGLKRVIDVSGDGSTSVTDASVP